MAEPDPAGLALGPLAARGFAVGGLVAAAVFVVFALLPGTRLPIALYVGLAAVLGVSVGLLVSVALVVRRAGRLPPEP